jgi:choline dehydrogenase-like flavoprotein
MLYEGEHRKLRAASIIESFNLPHLIRNEAGKWRKIARFKFVYEDIPQASNFISIDQQTLKPKVVFKNYSEYLLKSVEQIESDFLRYFSFLDIERYEIDADLQKSEYHLCATTPMGIDSENSVVDKNLVHHQWRNLLVLGSSVFPSITPANPTLTISALSLLAANHQWN